MAFKVQPSSIVTHGRCREYEQVLKVIEKKRLRSVRGIIPQVADDFVNVLLAAFMGDFGTGVLPTRIAYQIEADRQFLPRLAPQEIRLQMQQPRAKQEFFKLSTVHANNLALIHVAAYF